MKDFVDHLIQKRVITLDYWMGLKSKPVTESERTEDFLSLVMKFNREKYSLFLEALLETGHLDLVKELALNADGKPKKIRPKVKTQGHIQSGERSTGKAMGQTDADLVDENKPLLNKMDTEKAKSKKFVVVVEEEEKEAIQALQTTKDLTMNPMSMASKSSENISIKLTSTAPNATEDVNIKPKSAKEAIEYQNKITERLHHGKATIPPSTVETDVEDDNDIKDGKNNNNKALESQSQDQNRTASANDAEKAEVKNPTAKKLENESKATRPAPLTVDRKMGSAKSREEILEEREQNVINRETELMRIEKELDEKDKSLQELETNLIIRERSLVLEKQVNNGPSSLPKDIPMLHFGRHLIDSPAASSTQSSDYLAEVRDQIRELRRAKGEIEDETSFGPTPKPKEDYVKMSDLEIVQQDIADIKDGIATDRDGRESLKGSLHEQKDKIEILNSKIATMENEKAVSEKDFNQKITKLKSDLKNVKASQKENLNKVREEIKSKEEECQQLKLEMGVLKKNASELENRVSILETNKTWAEEELKRMEKEVANLKSKLNDKEGELSELRKILEETESERDDLIDEVAHLKNEIGRLRSDRKRLEQEKKTLLARCVKPGWNQNTRTTSFK